MLQEPLSLYACQPTTAIAFRICKAHHLSDLLLRFDYFAKKKW